MKRIAGMLLVAIAFAGVLWADNPLLDQRAGATTLIRCIPWFDEYHKKTPTLRSITNPLGSGGGIKRN
jgi:hypothetical protein